MSKLELQCCSIGSPPPVTPGFESYKRRVLSKSPAHWELSHSSDSSFWPVTVTDYTVLSNANKNDCELVMVVPVALVPWKPDLYPFSLIATTRIGNYKNVSKLTPLFQPSQSFEETPECSEWTMEAGARGRLGGSWSVSSKSDSSMRYTATTSRWDRTRTYHAKNIINNKINSSSEYRYLYRIILEQQINALVRRKTPNPHKRH
jgi:hypothetical protein